MIYGEQEIYDLLRNRDIDFQVTRHEAVYTVDEMKRLASILQTENIPKNLFIKNANKSQYYLVVLENQRRLDLKKLRGMLQSSALSFASEESLMELMHLTKGAVTPFGVLNDSGGSVEVIFDSEVTDKPFVGIHPNVNTATVALSYRDLDQLLCDFGHKPKIIRFED